MVTNTQSDISYKIQNIKDKYKVLKAARNKIDITYKFIRLTAGVSKSHMEALGDWSIFYVVRKKCGYF